MSLILIFQQGHHISEAGRWEQYAVDMLEFTNDYMVRIVPSADIHAVAAVFGVWLNQHHNKEQLK